jgi:hypothetical protein
MRLFNFALLVALLCSAIYGEATDDTTEDLIDLSAFNVSSSLTNSNARKLDSNGPER